jgi:uncharacterized OB-fold protein
MTTQESIPAAEGLFADTEEGPRLLGSRCRSCETPYFPKSEVCHNPDCGQSSMEEALFGPRGELWSCAIQSYEPPPPALFEKPYKPYALGVVDLPEGLRVLGRISTDQPERLQLGTEVELVLEELCRNQDGAPIISWKFKPVESVAGAGQQGEVK